MISNGALVLEGGSMRCLFTAGVLDVFLEENIHFPYVIGVSAGTFSGINYLTRQIGRMAKVNIDFAGDKRYAGPGSFLKNGSFFNFDFMFGELSQTLIPLDFDAFYQSEQRFVAVTTDCITGRPKYHEKGVSDDILLATQASASMPLLAPMVHVDGCRCLDGGVSMPIAYQEAMDQGYEKRVLVLTREQSYRKPPVKGAMSMLYRSKYGKYPHLIDALEQVPRRYNRMKEEITALEAAGEVFVLRPEGPVDVSRVEKDKEKLRRLYEQGRSVALKRLEEMRTYLGMPVRQEAISR